MDIYYGLGTMMLVCDNHRKDHAKGLSHPGEVIELYEDHLVKVVCNDGVQEITGKPFREPFIYAKV